MNEKKGIYIAFDLSKESQDKLLNFIEAQGLPREQAFNQYSTHLHATLFSSEESLSNEEYDNILNKIEPLSNFNYDINISPNNLEWISLVNNIMNNNEPNEKPIRKSVLALKIKSEFMNSLHQHIQNLSGLTHNRKEFNNHVSVNYNYQGSSKELEELKKIDFNLTFEAKIFIKKYDNNYSNSPMQIIDSEILTKDEDKNKIEFQTDSVSISSLKKEGTIHILSEEVKSVNDLLNFSKAENLQEYYHIKSKEIIEEVSEDVSKPFVVGNNYFSVNKKNREKYQKPKNDNDNNKPSKPKI